LEAAHNTITHTTPVLAIAKAVEYDSFPLARYSGLRL
jgi:hypothetical protein